MPFTCAPTGMPLGVLRGWTVPVASTVRTMSLRVMGANRKRGPFAREKSLEQPATRASAMAA